MSAILTAGICTGNFGGDLLAETRIKNRQTRKCPSVYSLENSSGEKIGSVHVENIATSDENMSKDTPFIDINICNETTGDMFTLNVKPLLMVNHLKEKIEREANISEEDQVLIFGETELCDDSNLDDLGITNQSQILLKNRLAVKIDIEIHNDVTGESFTLNVKPRLMVHHLKDKIERETDIDEEDQVLLFGETELCDDHSSIDDYDVIDESRILLKHRLTIKIEIEIYNEDTGERLTLEVKPRLFVHHLKDKIKRETGIQTSYQVLLFEETELCDDNNNMDDYDIVDKSQIILKTRMPSRIDIEICHESTGEKFALQVKPRLMVNHLKNLIERETCISVEDQILLFEENVINDDESLNDNDVDDKSQIILRQRAQSSQ